jgi:hypothetical protein
VRTDVSEERAASVFKEKLIRTQPELPKYRLKFGGIKTHTLIFLTGLLTACMKELG